MNSEIICNYLSDNGLRGSFNALARDTFGLDFEPWYQQGWSSKYHPYSILVDGQVVSNVSANRIDCLLNGQSRHYIQLGTVMTAEAHRGKGFCRQLMERVLMDFSSCDGIFLYANDSVLDFYPKFGFRPAKEYRFRTSLSGAAVASVSPVPMEAPTDWTRFLAKKKTLRSQGLLQLDTDGLLMFYLSGPMRDYLYTVPGKDIYIVAELEDGLLTVYDIFSSGNAGLLDICQAFGPQVRRVEFAFTPADQRGLESYEYTEEDTTLFLLGEPLIGDMTLIQSFPELAHT